MECRDKLIWKGNEEGKFSVRSCYRTLFEGDQSIGRIFSWEKLWKLKIHERLKLFLWRVKSNVIPTREVIANRLGLQDRSCSLCEVEVESALHISKECHCIRSLAFASKWGCRIDSWEISCIENLVDFCINPKPDACLKNMDKKTITIFLSTLLYFSWKFRNERIFSGHVPKQDLVFRFNRLVDEFLSTEEVSNDRSVMFEERWIAPPEGWWKINTDAAFFNGQAGIAFIVRDGKGKDIHLA